MLTTGDSLNSNLSSVKYIVSKIADKSIQLQSNKPAELARINTTKSSYNIRKPSQIC